MENLQFNNTITNKSELFQKFVPGIEHHTTGDILLHPQFRHVRSQYVRITSMHYKTNIFPGKWQSTAYRVLTIGALLTQYEAWDPENRDTYPTLARLKRVVALMSNISPRQIDQFVARLAQESYVVLRKTEIDNRLRLLKPTHKLLDWHGSMTASYFGILHILYPQPGYELAINRNPTYLRSHRATSASLPDVFRRIVKNNTDLAQFLNMNMGGLVLMHISTFINADQSGTAMKNIFYILHEEYRITRSQLRNIIVAAEASDLLVRSGRRNDILAMTARGHAAVDRFIADTLSSHDMIYRMCLSKVVIGQI